MRPTLARGIALSYLGRAETTRNHASAKLPAPIPATELHPPRIDSGHMLKAFGERDAEAAQDLMREEQSGSTLWVTKHLRRKI